MRSVLFAFALVLCLFAASTISQGAGGCKFVSPYGYQYDLSPAMSNSDYIGAPDGEPYIFYFSPCRNTTHCNASTPPPSASPFCQTSAFGPSFGCGSLQQFVQGDLMPPTGNGFWIQYNGGDRTQFGARSVNISCVCAKNAQSNTLGPTHGTYESSTPGTYQATFTSKYCCPASSPTPASATCAFCQEAVTITRMMLAANHTTPVDEMIEFLQPLCNSSVPTLSNSSMALCSTLVKQRAHDIVMLTANASINPNSVCSSLNLCTVMTQDEKKKKK